MKNKKGFTLIELLVAVLIIGILAAIALPQYQKVVEKSKLISAVLLLRSLRDGQINYFNIYGKYTRNLLDLDITFPGKFIDNKEHVYNMFQVKDIFFQLENGAANRVASAYRNRSDINLTIRLNGSIDCGSNTKKYQHICSSFPNAIPITQADSHSVCQVGSCWVF